MRIAVGAKLQKLMDAYRCVPHDSRLTVQRELRLFMHLNLFAGHLQKDAGII